MKSIMTMTTMMRNAYFAMEIIKIMIMKSRPNLFAAFSGHTKNVELRTYYSNAQRVGDAESRNKFQKSCIFIYLYLLFSKSSFLLKKVKIFQFYSQIS